MLTAVEALQQSVTRSVAQASQANLLASAFGAKNRHPGATQAVERGTAHTATLTCAYIDLTRFTRRTFWESHQQVVALGDAVVGGFAQIIHAFGGYVIGLRGDGLIAGFDGAEISKKAVALAATAVCLNTVEGPINEWLRAQRREGLQAKAGLDFGQVTFLPVAETSDYNMLGFALNFAAKCEKSANSWEVVAGQGFAGEFSHTSLVTSHEESPKEYTMAGTTKQYSFYDVSWRPFVGDANGVLAQLGNRSLEHAFEEGSM
jgi:adenylate cyclase